MLADSDASTNPAGLAPDGIFFCFFLPFFMTSNNPIFLIE